MHIYYVWLWIVFYYVTNYLLLPGFSIHAFISVSSEFLWPLTVSPRLALQQTFLKSCYQSFDSEVPAAVCDWDDPDFKFRILESPFSFWRLIELVASILSCLLARDHPHILSINICVLLPCQESKVLYLALWILSLFMKQPKWQYCTALDASCKTDAK